MNICVTLAGSYRGERFNKMKKLKKQLERDGVMVLYPQGKLNGDGFGFFESDNSDDEIIVERAFIEQTIHKCNAIIFCNYDNHLGLTSTMEFEIFNKINSFFSSFYNGFPIYLLENINYNELNEPTKLLVSQNITKGILKIGINKFYDDFIKKEEIFER